MTGETRWRARVIDVLRGSHVFGQLEEAVLAALVGEVQLRNVVGGTRVLSEGEPADSMFIVVSGRLRVSRRGPDGQLLLYNEISPGECVGETGMILQQTRTADVTALRDSTLAILSRPGFEALLARQPVAINRVFSQAIFNHLRHTSQLVQGRKAQSFVVIPLQAGPAAGRVAAGLVEALAAMGYAHHLTAADEARLDLDADASVQGMDRLDELESQFDYLVYEAGPTTSSWTRRAFRQADQIVFVADGDGDGALPPSAIERALADEPGFALKRHHLALLHPAATVAPGDVAAWRGGRDLERIYLLRDGRREDYSRLARFLTGRAVGVVLGGGGARGFAHLGVLRALEERGIPIDLVGGNSMGALIAAQYACGWSLETIEERTRIFALGGERPTLPVISLLSGKRMARDLQRMFGDTRIETLWRPYFAAACNLSQASITVQESGPLWRAVLASNSPAGLLPPVVDRGDLLVDGAILDNVPVSAMRVRLGTPLEKRRGNGTIIAVDVDVRDELGVEPDVDRLSVWNTVKGHFSPGGRTAPGIGAILYRAGHIAGLHQRGRTVAQADYYLEPPVAGFPLMAYRRAGEIAAIGYRHALEQIAQWDRRTLPTA